MKAQARLYFAFLYHAITPHLAVCPKFIVRAGYGGIGQRVGQSADMFGLSLALIVHRAANLNPKYLSHMTRHARYRHRRLHSHSPGPWALYLLLYRCDNRKGSPSQSMGPLSSMHPLWSASFVAELYLQCRAPSDLMEHFSHLPR
jgi:hypothetical protein